jgi:superfamily II DNA/RNA helicase
MFSATINKNVFELIKTYMHDPAFIDLTKGQKYKLPANIEHCVILYL